MMIRKAFTRIQRSQFAEENCREFLINKKNVIIITA